MNSRFFLILILFVYYSCVNPTYTNQKLSKEKAPKNLTELNYVVNENEIYSINHEELKKYLKLRNRKINIIVSYTYWCPSANYSFDEFASLEKDTNNTLVFFTADDWFYISEYKQYLTYKKFRSPTFILDINVYGKQFNPHPKYKKFFKQICTSCDTIGGFPSYIILDNELNLLYAKSGRLDSISRVILKSASN